MMANIYKFTTEPKTDKSKSHSATQLHIKFLFFIS